MNSIRLKGQSGFSLIEVLVAVIVLAIGLLGLGALQTVSLQNNQSAYMRSQATVFAYDIMDTMRTDRENALDGDYNLTMGSAPKTGSTFSATALKDWFDELSGALPSGQGSVACSSATEICQVTIQWDDTHALDGSASRQVAVSARL